MVERLTVNQLVGGSSPSPGANIRMIIENNFTKLIGNTPLIKLENVSKFTKCNILGKAEFLNPGQSVKDRAALYIIKDAIDEVIEKYRSGDIKDEEHYYNVKWMKHLNL